MKPGVAVPAGRLLAALQVAGDGPGAERRGVYQRGVNFTSERGAIYGSPESLAMLERLPEYGVDSIALVPYGFMPPGGSTVRFHPARTRWFVTPPGAPAAPPAPSPHGSAPSSRR